MPMQALIAKVSERNVKTEAYFLMSVSIKKTKNMMTMILWMNFCIVRGIALKGQTHGLIRFAVSSSDMIRL